VTSSPDPGELRPPGRPVRLLPLVGPSTLGPPEVAPPTTKETRLVRIQVEADRADEVHVHGYDLKGDVAPGQAGRHLT
jgi:hypothetical protein